MIFPDATEDIFSLILEVTSDLFSRKWSGLGSRAVHEK